MKHREKKTEKQWADEFNQLETASRDMKAPSAPPGEFENILKEMNRRGIKPKIREELEQRK